MSRRSEGRRISTARSGLLVLVVSCVALPRSSASTRHPAKPAASEASPSDPTPDTAHSPAKHAAVRAWIRVRGTIIGDVATIDALEWVHSAAVGVERYPGQAAVSARDARGRELASADLHYESSSGRFQGRLPAAAEVRRIELHVQGQLRAACSAPRVVLTSTDLTPGAHGLRWRGEDPDGDPLLYSVEWSEDNGATWRWIMKGTRALQIGAPATFGVTPGHLRVIRVTVTDGFFSHAVQSGSLFKPPGKARCSSCTIDQPVAGSVFLDDQLIFFRAPPPMQGYQLHWLSDRLGLLGSGDEVSMMGEQLGEGPHEISAVWSTAEGEQNVDRVTLHVGHPDIVLDMRDTATDRWNRPRRAPAGEATRYDVTLRNVGARASSEELEVHGYVRGTLMSIAGPQWRCTPPGRPIRCSLSSAPLEPRATTPPLTLVVKHADEQSVHETLVLQPSQRWTRPASEFPAGSRKPAPVPSFGPKLGTLSPPIADATPSHEPEPNAAELTQEAELQSGLAIISDPSGASVMIDAHHVGSTPLRVTGLAPVTHRVGVTCIDCVPLEFSFTTESGKLLRTPLVLLERRDPRVRSEDRAWASQRYAELLEDTAMERDDDTICDQGLPTLFQIEPSFDSDTPALAKASAPNSDCHRGLAARRGMGGDGRGRRTLDQAMRERRPTLCAQLMPPFGQKFHPPGDYNRELGWPSARQESLLCSVGYARFTRDPRDCLHIPSASQNEARTAQCMYDVQQLRGRFELADCALIPMGQYRARCVRQISLATRAPELCAQHISEPALRRLCAQGLPALPTPGPWH